MSFCLQTPLNPAFDMTYWAPRQHGERSESHKTPIAKSSPIITLRGDSSEKKDGTPCDKWKGADTKKNISEINIFQPES